MSKIKVYFTSIKGRRESNEDRHNIILNLDKSNEKYCEINLFSIYDGHGGIFVSNYLEEKIPNYYCRSDLKPPFSEKYHIETFEYLQNKILNNPEGFTSGSTCLLNLMYRIEDEIHFNIVNIGDSRLTIVYNNGDFKQVTIDHKPDDIIEKKRIEKIGGEIYTDSDGVIRIGDLSLSRAFGDGDNLPYISQKPDVFYKKITPETKFIIMACDGLWDVIENNELFDLLNNYKKNDKENYAVELVNEALKRGSCDNISIIVIEVI